ncbi:hypothetical protein PR002_g11346 [Phytophthora rubi]|uniref:PDZ domain-containing protein n=1 Tax=Phytophthora rubi TaxID=129364 RepID=A0A6A3M9E8_9STRA|nr:hypothetical protein PR002_g11346 [Phytophthora rubi]
MADESQGVVASSRQIHVLLTLLDGERSFGMSLAQKTPPLGASYTVVSSVFANSPADRAGVRKGYVVRCINDKPMNGLTVAQVASHFRNASQAKITLEVLESMSSPRTSAFAAAATFGGVAAVLPNVQIGAGDGREKRPMTGFSPASSGRAIAAPGTALAVPRVASPKQPVLRLSAKPAAKTLAVSRPQAAGVTSTATARNAGATGRTMLRADAKVSNGENHTGLKSKVVAPVLRLGLKPKPVPEEAAQKEVPAATKKIELKSAAKSVPSNTPDAKRELETSRIPQSPIQAIEENRGTTAQANMVPTSVSTPPATKSKTGKKRGRPRKNQVATNGTKSHKGKGKAKAKKTQKQQASDEADELLDDDEVFDMYAFSSNSDTEESPSKKTARRAANGRRRGVTDRTRHSLTVDRLVGMGFTKEDAEASVKEIGDDPDACMIWIIAKIEERQFTQDLNEASIQSEQSKRDEEKRVKEVEMETLVHAEKFMALFPTSYIACSESSASHLKKFLHSTIDQVDGETYIRKILTSLLTLEGKSIRWYKQAVRSYMLELAGRLDAALGDHDVMTCCARVSSQNADPSDVSCDFMRKILEEDKALTTALFEMPTNQGGVPPVFLECDEATKFDLDDDGFEVVEPDT